MSSKLETEDRSAATQALVEFLASYNHLLERQLANIRENMTRTVESIMDSISKINETATDKKMMADAILVKRADGAETTKNVQGDDSHFRAASAKDLGFSDPRDGSGSLELRSREAKGRFRSHMDALSSADQEMGDLLFQMIGALSADDVVGQRLLHVGSAISALKVGLCDVLTASSPPLNSALVAALQGKLLLEMTKQFTTEEEKTVFAKVFPMPKAS